MRNYKNLELYLNNLQSDIYTQPSDEGHTDWCADFIHNFFPDGVTSVLDVGCGDGFSKKLFPGGINWRGVTLDLEEIQQAANRGISLVRADFTFLNIFADGSFDLVFARHVLEHSPMPLLSLMEWHRVSNRWLMVVLPAADYWGEGGKNHYYVLPKENWWYLFDRAGWVIVSEDEFTTAHWLFMKHFLPEQEDRSMVHWEGRPKIVEYRYLLRKK